MNVYDYVIILSINSMPQLFKTRFLSPQNTMFLSLHIINWKINLILFCLPIKPALNFAIIHNFQRSFLQGNLGTAKKNDRTWSRPEHSSCVDGRRHIACTYSGFPPSTIAHYILIQLLHKKPFSYSMLSFSLLSLGWRKKKIL